MIVIMIIVGMKMIRDEQRRNEMRCDEMSTCVAARFYLFVHTLHMRTQQTCTLWEAFSKIEKKALFLRLIEEGIYQKKVN